MAVATVRPAANEMPTITTVFLGDEGLHHARCGQAMVFLRTVSYTHLTLPTNREV